MTRDQLAKTVTDFMDRHASMTLACCDGDEPWTAAVYYARQRFDLVFFSSPGSRHCSIFAKNPRAAAVIHGEYRRWQEIKGLQMEGAVEPVVSAAAKAKATAAYLARYPFVREFLSSPVAISAEVASKMSRVALHVFRPRTIRYLDNEGGFGNRWRLDVCDGQPVGEPVRG
jgi:uncharacterized protein